MLCRGPWPFHPKHISRHMQCRGMPRRRSNMGSVCDFLRRLPPRRLLPPPPFSREEREEREERPPRSRRRSLPLLVFLFFFLLFRRPFESYSTAPPPPLLRLPWACPWLPWSPSHGTPPWECPCMVYGEKTSRESKERKGGGGGVLLQTGPVDSAPPQHKKKKRQGLPVGAGVPRGRRGKSPEGVTGGGGRSPKVVVERILSYIY